MVTRLVGMGRRRGDEPAAADVLLHLAQTDVQHEFGNRSAESVTIILARCRVRFGFQPDAYNHAK